MLLLLLLFQLVCVPYPCWENCGVVGRGAGGGWKYPVFVYMLFVVEVVILMFCLWAC